MPDERSPYKRTPNERAPDRRVLYKRTPNKRTIGKRVLYRRTLYNWTLNKRMTGDCLDDSHPHWLMFDHRVPRGHNHLINAFRYLYLLFMLMDFIYR